jgi:cell division protein FtsL
MPEKVALTYLFFAYAAAFAILIAYVTRAALETRKLEARVSEMKEQITSLEARRAETDKVAR